MLNKSTTFPKRKKKPRNGKSGPSEATDEGLTK